MLQLAFFIGFLFLLLLEVFLDLTHESHEVILACCYRDPSGVTFPVQTYKKSVKIVIYTNTKQNKNIYA